MGFDQHPHEGIGYAVRPKDIDVENIVQFFVRPRGEQSQWTNAGVVDQPVQSAPGARHLLECRLHLFSVPHIHE